MRHQKKRNKLSRDAGHRKALIRNLCAQVLQHERVQTSEAKAKVIKEYQPVAKTYGTRSDKLFAAMAQVDGSQPLAQFTQTVLGGQTDAKSALTTLQQGLSTIVKS